MALAEPSDDGRQDVCQLGPDEQYAFLVVLGRSNLEQRNKFVRICEFILNDRQLGEFEELLESNPCMAQCLNDRPAPERVVFRLGGVTSFPSVEPLHHDFGRSHVASRAFLGVLRYALVRHCRVLERLPHRADRRAIQ